MAGTWKALVKRDVWKLIILLIIVTLLNQLPVVCNWLSFAIKWSDKVSAAAFVLSSEVITTVFSLMALAVLPYWAGAKDLWDHKAPFLYWAAVCVAYALLRLVYGLLPILLHSYGNMSLAQTAQYVSVALLVLTLVRYGLFVVLLAVFFSVLEDTSLLGGFKAFAAQGKGVLLVFIGVLALVLWGGGIAKWFYNPRFPLFVVFWTAVAYGFAAANRSDQP